MPDHKTIGRGFEDGPEETGKVPPEPLQDGDLTGLLLLLAEHVADSQRLVIFLQEVGQQAVTKECLGNRGDLGGAGLSLPQAHKVFWAPDRERWWSLSMTPPGYLAEGPLNGNSLCLGFGCGGQ